jgi:tRNA(Ile)-lysidine synthase
VEKLCTTHQIPFTLVEKDVEEIARACHISTEEAGRNVRYEAFYKELDGREGKIAVAHNKNDCCETFLFNLFRGSALKGLSGIKPKRDMIIRPLLCLERSEIEAYLYRHNIAYRTDSTNLTDDYTRNKIRHRILETEAVCICPQAVNNISKACERIDEAYALIADITAQAFAACVTEIDNNFYKRAYHITESEFEKVHDTIKGYVVMETLAKTAGKSKDIESVHVNAVRELFGKQSGSMVSLPYQMIARRDYTGVIIFVQNENAQDQGFCRDITSLERTCLESGKELIINLENNNFLTLKILDNYEKIQNLENFSPKKYTKLFDYDKIEGNIAIRTRKAGDYLTVNSMNQTKKLKAYFTDEKIPKDVRDHMLLLANDSHIIWAIGGRISNYYKIARQTDRILQVTFYNETKED